MRNLPATLGELKSTGYKSKTIKTELRDNLIEKISKGDPIFDSIIGFDDTVLPDIERAILSRHNILLLGLRGQAKTRIARLMINLLDEYIPVITGTELNDDPLMPISRQAKDLVEEHGDKTPVEWIHRSRRYVEKLATPDVSIADLIGDVDPIKAATLKLPYSDERVIHFGLIPRSHRSIFVINELPDLQARIQVSLFNILQEGDLQIRGFKLRLPLDIQFVFTANPEDYTNRGSIITPLKDRIESQILTHYPRTLDISKSITRQEARVLEAQSEKIAMPDVIHDIMERIVFNARHSEFVDENSGVSARMSITGYENLYSTAERRMIRNNEDKGSIRISDFWGVIPAITGKVELVYEGEQEGPYQVAISLINKSLKEEFLKYFPNPGKEAKNGNRDRFGVVRAWFAGGNEVAFANDLPEKNYRANLMQISGLEKIVKEKKISQKEKYVFMELLLHGLAEFNIINKDTMDDAFSFRDLLANMLDDIDEMD